MFMAAILVTVLAIIAIFKGITQRIRNSQSKLKLQITNLENRINDLENNKN